jgi:putative ABC transport system permease protein
MRARVFDLALNEAVRERRLRRRRAGTLTRPGVEILFLTRVLAAALECRTLARAARQPDPPRPRSFMLRQDVTFALRMLRRSPGFTLAAVLATALGIGANTAIFTVVKQVLLQPLPYPDPSRIVDVTEYARGAATAVSPPNFMDWRAQNHTLATLGAYTDQIMTLSGGFEPTRVNGALFDAAVLDALAVAPMAGRAFTVEDTRAGARRVAILGYDLWQRVYGGDRAMVSRTVTLEGEAYEVVGILPNGFDFPGGSEIWTPLGFTAADLRDNQRGAHYVAAVGRLRPGVTARQAADDLNAIEQRIAVRFPDKLEGYTTVAVPLLASITEGVQRPLLILFGAVAFVLLIACVNVSNLLLARGTTRTGEIAVRAALGAGRWRLIRQLLAESVALSLAGGAAGLLLASWGVRALMRVAPADLPRASAVQMDAPVLLFSVVLSIAAGVIFGSVPALVASRPDLAVFLKDVRRDGGSSGGRRRLRGLLVAAQVALALVLLTGAGLAIRSFHRLTHVDPGFRAANVLSVGVSLPAAAYPTRESEVQFFQEYVDRVQPLPGVTAAGAVSIGPVTRSGFGGSFTIIGRPAGADEGNAQVRSVTPGYMEALSIPLRAGRLLDARDSAGAARVALVSETAARRFWPGENPVGRQLRVHVNERISAAREIVGVVGDVRTRGLELAAVPVIYVPHAQYGPESMVLMVRAGSPPEVLVPEMKAALHEMAPQVALAGRRRWTRSLGRTWRSRGSARCCWPSLRGCRCCWPRSGCMASSRSR